MYTDLMKSVEFLVSKGTVNIIIIFLPNDVVEVWTVDRFDGSQRSSVASVEFNTFNGINITDWFSRFDFKNFLGKEKEFLQQFNRFIEANLYMKLTIKVSNTISYKMLSSFT